MGFKKVVCPNCQRTIAHYIEGSGTDSIYRVTCPRCSDKKPIIIYSAGQTMIAETIETTIEINIKY